MAYNPFPKPVKRQGPSPAEQFFSQEMNDPGGPTVASRYVDNNPQQGLLSLGNNETDVSMPEKPENVIRFDEHMAQRAAADDGSSAPMAARRFVDAYMADPEWKKAHASEDDIVEKLAPGIGTMILDRLTRGAYSQGRVRQLEAARLQKHDVEKRYFDIQTREDFLRKDQRDEFDATNKSALDMTKANESWATERQTRELAKSEEQRRIDLQNANLAAAAAHTKLLGVQADVAQAGRVISVPPNYSTFTRDPVTGQAIPFAKGQDKEFAPGSNRDYGEPTGNMVRGSIEADAIRMKKSRDDAAAGQYPSQYAGMTDAEIDALAIEGAGRRGGQQATPSANPQYLAAPPGIAKPQPNAKPMYLPGASTGVQAPPMEDPNTKRVRIRMNGGNPR